MDSGLIIRTNARTAPARGGARRESTTRSATATDLSPSQIVTAAPSAPAVRNDVTGASSIEVAEIASTVLDAQSREVLYRTLDVGARSTERRTPEAVAGRLKAYARSAKVAASLEDAHADIKA